MENISFKIGCLTTLILLASSCYSYKKLMKDGEGAEDDAIENVIVDYYHNNKQEIKNYDVFVLELKRDNNFLYNILVDYQQNKEILKSEDKIGTYSNSFPTMYKIYNSKLFIWNDSKTPINQETLNILYKYNKLDSTYIKLDLALIDSNNYDPPMFRIVA